MKHVLINTALSFAGCRAKENPKWKLSHEELADIEIRYPSTYEHIEAHTWFDTFLMQLRRRVKVVITDLPQPHRGTVLIQFVKKGRVHDVAIDYSDYPDIVEESVNRCPMYFKMQHLTKGYAYENVVPGGYVNDSWRLYLHLKRLRKMRDKRRFLFDVYGRFGLEFAKDVRGSAIELLEQQNRFMFEGGAKTVRYDKFLEEIARAKICIDLPGNGAFCFRLPTYMAIGACVIAFPHTTKMHVPLEPGKHIVYTKPDLSDLVDLCEYYLTHSEKREAICRESRRYFEENLHKDNLVNYYLHTCYNKL